MSAWGDDSSVEEEVLERRPGSPAADLEEVSAGEGVVAGVEVVAQAKRAPEISRAFMLLDGGEVELDAGRPECREVGQQRLIELSVLLEPVGGELVAGQMRSMFSQHRTQPLMERGASEDDIVPVRLEEMGL